MDASDAFGFRPEMNTTSKNSMYYFFISFQYDLNKILGTL
jgi:hypothetical protein